MIVRIFGDPDELVGWSKVYNTEWSPKRFCQGPRSQGVGRGGGGGEQHLTLHCHHQNNPCIKTGGNESQFNISLMVRDKVTRHCPKTTVSEEKGEPKRTSLATYQRPSRLI